MKLMALEDLYHYRDIYRDGEAEVYLRRFFVLPPYPRGETGDDTPWSIKIHKIMLSDEAEVLHDHPWDFKTLILSGGYWEEKFNDTCTGTVKVWHGPGSVIEHKAEDFHRLDVPEPTTTFVITGARRREWGFQTFDGWVHWSEYEQQPAGTPDPYVATLRRIQEEEAEVERRRWLDEWDFEHGYEIT
jgi:hypothetical protein